MINDIKENELQRKRKRTISTDADKNQSKGKKKKENAIIKNFEYMKKKFETESQVIQENFYVDSNNTEDVNHDEITPRTEIVSKNEINSESSNISKDMNLVLDIDSDNFINNDVNINNILTEIEKEMSKRKSNKINSNFKHRTNCSETAESRDSSALTYKIINKIPYHHKSKIRKAPTKSNYTFIDLLERNVDLSDDNDESVERSRYHGFSDSVKGYINKFILKTETETKVQDTNIQSLLSEDKTVSDKEKISNEIENIKSDGERNLPTHKLYPYYEIKEILDGQNIKETEVNSSSQKLVMNGPSNIVTDNNETHEFNDSVESLVFMKSDYTLDNISLLDKETVSSCNENNVKIEEINGDLLPFLRKSTNTNDISPKKMTITEYNNLNVIPVTYKPNECSIIDSTCTKTTQQNIEEISSKNCITPRLLKTENYKRALTPKHLTYSDRCQIISVTTVSNNDQQIIFKPVYTNNYNHPQLMNYCSSNAFCNGNRNEYVKKYYLSTREVVIETREMDDYNIRVLKEIKMDLNITRTVSNRRSQQSYNAVSDVMNRDNIKELENNPPPMPIQENKHNSCYSNQPANNWNLQNTDEPNKTVDQVCASRNRIAENTKNIFYDRSYSSYEEINNIQNISQGLHRNLRQDTELINAVNNKLYNGSDDHNDVKPFTREGEENENIIKTPPSEIHNLLKKYSKILG